MEKEIVNEQVPKKTKQMKTIIKKTVKHESQSMNQAMIVPKESIDSNQNLIDVIDNKTQELKEKPIKKSVVKKPVVKKPVVKKTVFGKTIKDQADSKQESHIETNNILQTVAEKELKKKESVKRIKKEPVFKDRVVKKPVVKKQVKDPVIVKQGVKNDVIKKQVIKDTVVKKPLLKKKIAKNSAVASTSRATTIDLDTSFHTNIDNVNDMYDMNVIDDGDNMDKMNDMMLRPKEIQTQSKFMNIKNNYLNSKSSKSNSNSNSDSDSDSDSASHSDCDSDNKNMYGLTINKGKNYSTMTTNNQIVNNMNVRCIGKSILDENDGIEIAKCLAYIDPSMLTIDEEEASANKTVYTANFVAMYENGYWVVYGIRN